MEHLAHGARRPGFGLWGRAELWLALARGWTEGREMMSGLASPRPVPVLAPPRRYDVVARGGGWSIVLGGACTRPFRSRRAAERIARTLQRQADALHGVKRPRKVH